MAEPPLVVDCLQYCSWSESIFRQLREGGVDAVHTTICHHADDDVARVMGRNWLDFFAQSFSAFAPAS